MPFPSHDDLVGRRIRCNAPRTHAAVAVMAFALMSGASWPHTTQANTNDISQLPGTTTAPVVTATALLTDGQISGCAVQAVFQSATGVSDVRFALVKDSSQRGGTKFVLSGSLNDPSGTPLVLEKLVLTTAEASTSGFSALVDRERGTYETSGTFEALEGGTVMRDLMLSGATIALSVRGRPRVDLILTGPLAASVRTGYLQCAGDLFRPE